MISQMSDGLYVLSPPRHSLSQSVTRWALRHAFSPANTSLIERHRMRCCQEVGASFCRTHSVLSPSHMHDLLSILSAVGSLQVDVWVGFTHHAEAQSPCEHPSAALDVLWWRSDGERWKEIHLDRKIENVDTTNTVPTKKVVHFNELV